MCCYYATLYKNKVMINKRNKLSGICQYLEIYLVLFEQKIYVVR